MQLEQVVVERKVHLRRLIVAPARHQAAEHVVEAVARVARRHDVLLNVLTREHVEVRVRVALLVVDEGVEAIGGRGELAHDLRVEELVVLLVVAVLERQQVVLLGERVADERGQVLGVDDVLIHGDVEASRLLEHALVVPVRALVREPLGQPVVIAQPNGLRAEQVRALLGVVVGREVGRLVVVERTLVCATRKRALAVGQLRRAEQAVLEGARDRIVRVDEAQVEVVAEVVPLHARIEAALVVAPAARGAHKRYALEAVRSHVEVVRRQLDRVALVVRVAAAAAAAAAVALALDVLGHVGSCDVVSQGLAEEGQVVGPHRLGRMLVMDGEREEASARQHVVAHHRSFAHLVEAVVVVRRQEALVARALCAPPVVGQVVARAVVAAVRVALVALRLVLGFLLIRIESDKFKNQKVVRESAEYIVITQQ